jgi:addiction module HigA family antidote
VTAKASTRSGSTISFGFALLGRKAVQRRLSSSIITEPQLGLPPPATHRDAVLLTIRNNAPDALAPVHPGEILLEEFLVPYKLTPYAAAARMGVPRTRIERVARCEAPVTVDTALRLARLFGTTAQFWMNLQLAYDLATAEVVDLQAIAPLVHAA